MASLEYVLHVLKRRRKLALLVCGAVLAATLLLAASGESTANVLIAVSKTPAKTLLKAMPFLTALPMDTAEVEERRFVIFTQVRSGSEYLVSLLGHHPQIFCAGEIFNGNFLDAPPPANASIVWNVHVDWMRTYYDGKIAQFRFGEKRTVGFKHLYYDADPQLHPDLFAWIKENNIFVIHLIRRNRFEQFLSNIAAQKSDRYTFRGNTTIPDDEQQPLDVNLNDMVAFIDETNLLERSFRSNLKGSVPYVEVFYEELKNKRFRSSVLATVFTFLGAQASFDFDERSAEDVPVRIHGQHSCQKRVTNWDDVRSVLAERYPVYLEACG